MKQRRAPTQTWKMIETVFRGVAGRSWRRVAAHYLGVDRAHLCVLYDTDDLDGEETDWMIVRMEAALADRRAHLDKMNDAFSGAKVRVGMLADKRHAEKRQIEHERVYKDDYERCRLFYERFEAELAAEAAAEDA